MIDETDTNLSISDRASELAGWVATLPRIPPLELISSSQSRSDRFTVRDTGHSHDLDLWLVGGLSLEAAARDRFIELIRVLTHPRHPNIVPIVDAGVHEGRAFLLSPQFVCRNLKERIRSESLTVAEAVDLAIALARAVDCLHGRGIVQIDLVTSAVLLRDDGFMTFDIRRTLERRMLEDTGEWIHGGITGCEAPEMIRGSEREIGRETDVYALGAILYEMLTGRAALIRGAVGPEAIRNILESEAEKPRSFNHNVDLALESICLRCLEKGPKRRYATAGSLADELERWRSKVAKRSGLFGWFKS